MDAYDARRQAHGMMNGPQAGYAQNAIGLAPADPTVSPIRDQISATESWLSDLSAAIDNIEKRLDTVLTPAPPSGGIGANTAAQSAMASHLHGRLKILNEGFSYLLQRIASLQSRIEL